MHFWVVGVLVLTLGTARAQPLRVTIECEQPGRTKACPAFLLGFVEANRAFLSSPRAVADVVLYANSTEVALVDRIHLRFVANVPGAPREIELDVDVDSRGDDDAQRAQLEPAFLRGMALFVAARFPKLVTVTLAAPEGEEATAKDTSPWDVSLELGGFGNYTERYQSYHGWGTARIAQIERQALASLSLFANGGLNRQPPLVVDGAEVSVDSSNWSIGGALKGAWLYSDSLSFGAAARVSRDDPKGQFRCAQNTYAGVEWDRYRADDPRGNRLALMYAVGYHVERYNLRNEIGETFAHYPAHTLTASAELRKDKVTLGLALSIGAELIHPMRRHHVTASPEIEWQIGDHVDLNVSFSITKRELPGPDESLIDPEDYAQLSRLAYAEPLAMNGMLSLRIHRDRTNGERNNRFDDL